ncbi:MAG: MBL fold metallo-hydrolase [Bryobacteraceae bacterium]|nr:MBL fold metallo-hydrolase [Bryobacteraceae bacterium]MCX7602906.1 MBL fold metallo-hydrolase [Bryobacteraceae bacterium]
MRTALMPLLLAALASAATHPSIEFQTRTGPLKLTAIRHASLMLEAGGKVIHVDPWSQGDYTGLPKADILLITDTHGDHFDLKAIEAVRRPDTLIIAPPAVAEKLPGVRVLRNGESMEAGAFHIEALPMYNLKRGPAEGQVYHVKGRGNGYVVSFGGFRLYIAGDTEGIPEMRALKNIDAALICMNLPYTMPPEEAADAVKAFRPKVAIPYHYRGSDVTIFARALEGSGIEVKLLDWYH